MRNGLMTYKPARGLVNIGDYIQSLAAAQFFDNKIDNYIIREELDLYEGEEMRLIMNGWFTSEPDHWPPAPAIKPLFVAFHINSLAKEQILSEKGIDYLKKHAPIGCRDEDTAKMLLNKDVDAYFSGCLTLTLGLKYRSSEKNDQIYFVDPFSSTEKTVSSLFEIIFIGILKFNLIKRLTKKRFQTINWHSLKKTISFYRQYSRHFTDDVLLRAEYIQHEISQEKFSSEEDRFEYAKNLLAKYAKAKFVVTSRIHCALPCLALETPVLFIDNAQQAESSYCRLNGLRELFNLVTSNKGELIFHFDKGKNKIGIANHFNNKPDYLRLKEKLIETCIKFVNIKL